MNSSIISELLAGLPVHHRSLPGIKFFEPKPIFARRMLEQFKGSLIYDVGAGIGHVSLTLAEAGFTVTALDLIPRDNPAYPVLLTNAVSYRFTPGAVVMFCRPCHNGFVEATIRQGINRGVSTFVYVSLPKNVDTDLGRYRRRFKRDSCNVGLDNESLYTM